MDDGREGIFWGRETDQAKLFTSGDTFIHETSTYTFTTFNYLQLDPYGYIAFRAVYSNGLNTKPGIFVYDPEMDILHSAIGDLGLEFGEIEDVGAPTFQRSYPYNSDNLYFAIYGTIANGIVRGELESTNDNFNAYLVDGATLPDGSVMTFTLQDRLFESFDGILFTTHITPTGKALVSCISVCSTDGEIQISNGNVVQNDQTILWSDFARYEELRPELVLRSTISGTQGVSEALLISNTKEIVPVIIEGDLMDGGGSVESFSGITTQPIGSELGTFVTTINLTGTQPGGQSILLIDRNQKYAGGSILNHIIFEYGEGVFIERSSPYIANSLFQLNSPYNEIYNIDSVLINLQGSPIIENNIFENNLGEAIYARDTNHVTIKRK